VLSEVLGELDFITILAADPGSEKRPCIGAAGDKLRAAARAREVRRLDFTLQVEGGVGSENLEELVRAGADILVVGSAIFHSSDPKARLVEMMRLATSARQISNA
jgi:ribulose-phosphate 3-epimerase